MYMRNEFTYFSSSIGIVSVTHVASLSGGETIALH